MTFLNRKIIDGHVHYAHFSYEPGLMALMEEAGIDKLAVVCTPDQQRLSLVPDALLLKAKHPHKVYVFGGLDITPLFMAPGIAGEAFAHCVDVLMEMGVDGVKMIEGKVQIRKQLPIPDFDAPVYAPYWEHMSETGMPLIFHVNDPEEFWDPERVPDWAREMGWFYGDGTYINNEAQYQQGINVLERYPGLRVTFAHFFFLSAQLDRLAGYLDRFPNMHVDLTPGIEMYHNFSRQPEKARDFFLKYQDRILYGTDIGARALLGDQAAGIEQEESLARIEVVRGFLENEGPFTLAHEGFLFGGQEAVFQGIHLPGDVLDKIYFQNFERFAGAAPKPLNPQVIVEEGQRLQMMINVMAELQPGTSGDTSSADELLRVFSG